MPSIEKFVITFFVSSLTVFILVFGFSVYYSNIQIEKPATKIAEEFSTEISGKTIIDEKVAREQSVQTKNIIAVKQPAPQNNVAEVKQISGLPFITQAPLGEWADLKQKYGCEEALMLMAWGWITSTPISSPTIARDKILALVDWQKKNYDFFYDTSVSDTAKIFKGYFKYNNVKIIREATIGDIKNAIDSNQIVFIPLDGRKLNNPRFKPPGPIHHMIIIKGYDETNKEFITNEPGTIYGNSFRYSYNTITNAWRDYPTGLNEEITDYKRNLLVINK
ncbi:MAG: hypothetical protein A2571_00880 [Candidatus Vogelbacteria bacterium RIFOXYD1_FULL_44_32]|uniref:Peptidase C39-like domain-containing protein n=1 Tax=Candidatus Vogelbacteria bacterium RIFOXYD1_FULL_44_32 TaxID=1802438 RepID=A0A1G2QFT4_9BACT|nr:MAG: hypothetical protein A2571_00880 [Candidatus Vogelbacteria bacterium RIFOXYD1_FULL_44_32]